MQGSAERTYRVLKGARPDRAPLFDLVPNDAVLRHFNGGAEVAPGDDRAAARALAAAVDGTRIACLSPMPEGRVTLSDGRVQHRERWTVWTPHRAFSSTEEYRREKEAALGPLREAAARAHPTADDWGYKRDCELLSWFGDECAYLLTVPIVGLMGMYDEVGLEFFCYALADCPQVISETLELLTERGLRWIEGLPEDLPFQAAFLGEDIAFRSGPMFSPAWLRREYFPRLERLVRAVQARGLRVVFHSDGDLNPIMDDLVAAGIDALNPVEVMAGMDLADLHRRYPRLVFAGGIDVSHLLPFGSPSEVRDAVVKAIEDTEGQILVGSSTELHNAVPLANFLALREAAMGYRY